MLQQDALPTVGAWCNWIEVCTLYYAGNPYGLNQTHCIGKATSPNPEGSFTPATTPFACNIGQGGSIDPSGFVDVDGHYYVTYKIDGNSLGHGGCFFMLQEVEPDGVTPIGTAVHIID